MRPMILVGACVLVSGLVLGAVFRTGSVTAAAHGVRVGDDFKFHDAVNTNSSTTTITAGDSVVWTWDGGMPHSVTSDAGLFDEPPGSTKATGTFSFAFMTPGTYAYYCRIHGGAGGVGMAGTIVVQAAAPTATTAANTPSATAQATGTATAQATGTGTAPATSTAPAATGTVAATSTPVPAATSAAGQPSVATGGTGAGTALPNAGDGGGSSRGSTWLPWAMVLAGGSMLAVGFIARLRKRRG